MKYVSIQKYFVVVNLTFTTEFHYIHDVHNWLWFQQAYGQANVLQTYPAVTLKVLLEDAQDLTRPRLPLGNISIVLRDISGRRPKDLQ